jgi:hypothetical protein
MPTSLNSCGDRSAGTEFDFPWELAGMFAIFWATPKTPCEMAEPGLIEVILSEPAFETTADIPPMTTPESLQEAATDCGTGDAHKEGIGKAPDMITDGDW